MLPITGIDTEAESDETSSRGCSPHLHALSPGL